LQQPFHAKVKSNFVKSEEERVASIIMARDEAQLWRVALFYHNNG